MVVFMGLAGIGLGIWIVGGFWGALGGFVMGTIMGEHEEKKARRKQLEEEQIQFFMQQRSEAN